MSETKSAPWPALKRNLVAILRGIAPDEILPVAQRLLEAGFEAIEIPLNSPDPFRSIEALAKAAPAGVLVGAGTVLDPADVARLDAAGGRLLVSPNLDPAVLAAGARARMVTMPGVFTPTEAFLALRSGASGLKFFPAGVLGVEGIKAMGAVLPKGTVIAAVGGVSDENFAIYAQAGVRAFGLGSSLYKAGLSPAEVGTRARAAVKAYDAVFGARSKD
ncbi:MAG: 2-dehydro-3-deoxy-6-phosphogalactonate aldolase [Rhizobiaceae bacterium]|nr:2-dehydro-3-deoxy-6-phosphogalactonate aldolase [Rhizobiaceae bacterium]